MIARAKMAEEDALTKNETDSKNSSGLALESKIMETETGEGGLVMVFTAPQSQII